jgi:hypothetical protein
MVPVFETVVVDGCPGGNDLGTRTTDQSGRRERKVTQRGRIALQSRARRV